MPVENQTTNCGSCGIELDESPSIPIYERKPCPNCGSLNRHVAITINDTFELHDNLVAKGSRPDSKKPFIEQFVGDDLQKSNGKWMEKQRVIDRDNDKYDEVVKNPETGEIIHECHEPLSKHIGHGTTKSKM